MDENICPIYEIKCTNAKSYLLTIKKDEAVKQVKCCGICTNILKEDMNKNTDHSAPPCGGCGKRLDEIRQDNKLGCPLCYEWFLPDTSVYVDQMTSLLMDDKFEGFITPLKRQIYQDIEQEAQLTSDPAKLEVLERIKKRVLDSESDLNSLIHGEDQWVDG